jgi:hypothetical protein
MDMNLDDLLERAKHFGELYEPPDVMLARLHLFVAIHLHRDPERDPHLKDALCQLDKLAERALEPYTPSEERYRVDLALCGEWIEHLEQYMEIAPEFGDLVGTWLETRDTDPQRVLREIAVKCTWYYMRRYPALFLIAQD